jgi:hypothetical protein
VIWQDFVLTFGGVVLAAGLMPALFAPTAPPLKTSATMAAVLAAYVVAMGSLGLYFAAGTVAVQAAIWAALGARASRQASPTDRVPANFVGYQLRAMAATARREGGTLRVSDALLHDLADQVNGLR